MTPKHTETDNRGIADLLDRERYLEQRITALESALGESRAENEILQRVLARRDAQLSAAGIEDYDSLPF